MKNLLISVATYNRKKTTGISLLNLKKHSCESSIYIYDDCSNQYDVSFLQAYGLAKRNDKNLGVHKTKENQFRDFLNTDYEYLYITDSDAIHDPSFISVLKSLPKDSPISLYTSVGSEIPLKNIENDRTFLRRYSGGISHFYTKDMVKEIVAWLNSGNSFKAWDYEVMDILGERMRVTRVSYADHLGKNGIHSGLNWDHDRALNPTRYLKKLRCDSIMHIEGCGEFPLL